MFRFLINSTFIFIYFFIYFIAFSTPIHAKVYINELFPAPSPATTGAEWVELYNDSNEEVDITGFTLKDISNNSLTIVPKKIPALGYIIATSSSVLNNGGDTIILRNSQQEVVDSVQYPSINTNQSYIRCPNGGTNTLTTANTTREQSNYSACTVLTPSPIFTPTPTVIPSMILTPTNIIPSISPTITPDNKNVYISEVMVNPSSGEKEWVELFNDNETAIIMDEWYIDDIENGGSSPRSFKITIPPKQFGIIELSSGIFNNTEDHVRLLDNNENEIDSFEYIFSQENISWGKNGNSNQFCIQLPSKSTVNNECLVYSPTPIFPTTTKKPTPTKTQKTTKSTIQDEISEEEYITFHNNIDSSNKNIVASTKIKKPVLSIKKDHLTKKEPTVLGENISNYRVIEQPHPHKKEIKNIVVASFSYVTLALGSLIIKVKESGLW